MNNKYITLLTTWDNEIIEVELDFQSWLQTKTIAKNNGEDGIYLKTHNRYLKFSNLKDEKGKIKYIAIETSKEYKEVTKEIREKRDAIIKKLMEDTFESRKKAFYLNREKILKDLEKDEKRFGLETTISKLQKKNV